MKVVLINFREDFIITLILILQNVQLHSLWSKASAECFWAMEVSPQLNSLTTPDARLSCQHSGFPLCQRVSCSCRERSFIPSPLSRLVAVKPVDFTIATERTKLGNIILGDDHLTYAISGFQINSLGTAKY